MREEGEDDAATDRRAELGRIAALLFLAGGVASLPANLLLADAPRAVVATNALAFLSGLVCLALPWRRFTDRSLHVLAAVATVEVTLSGLAAGPHAGVFAWYFLLVAIFLGYVFRNRLAVAAHLVFVLAGLWLCAIVAHPGDPDALVRALVAGPTLCVGAGIVMWLREGLETSQAHLREMAAARRLESLTDALTGLSNRRRLLVDLDAALHDGGPHTLALFDLDGFKAYNDAYGHLAGDHLLSLLADRLAGAMPAGGRAYRLGGDEFCALVPETGPGAERHVALASDALASEDEERGVGCSTGWVRLPDEATTASAALSVADDRMYAAKGAGRRRR